MPEHPKGSPNAAFSFFNSPASAPLPGLAASAANRLPRWALFGLLLLYLLHGLFHRDAWRGEDLIGIALARSTAEALLSGDFSALLLPQLNGIAWNGQGPLWTAVLAIFMLPVYAWSALQHTALPLTLIDEAARIPLAIAMALGFTALWKATDRFARRREAQPLDPLGVGPKSQDFGKTLADCALLLAIATLGVIYPWHQAGTAAIGFLWQGLLLWSLATAPETPKRAATQCALIIAGSLLTHGLGLALANLITLALVFRFVAPYRLVADHFVTPCLKRSAMLIGLWVVLTVVTLPLSRVGQWWVEGLAHWSVWRWVTLDAGGFGNLRVWFNESLWKWWPLWPIALFGLWRARHVKLSTAPHWAVPLISTLVVILLGLIGPSEWKIHYLAPVAALAVISAFSLLSLPRAVVNLIDWFAVALFTSLGIFIWVYWIALNFGVPQNLAQRASSLAPGVQGNANVYEVMMGLFATLAWIALITWRIRKGNPRLWRPVVLSAGGLTLLWVLLMTLWRPAIDRIQGQYTLARSLESGWVRAASARLSLTSGGVRAVIARQRQQFRQRVGDPSACVQLSQESPALDAIAVALTNLPVADQSTCAWRLALFNPNSKTSERWKIIWQSSATEDRRSRERFVLLERNP